MGGYINPKSRLLFRDREIALDSKNKSDASEWLTTVLNRCQQWSDDSPNMTFRTSGSTGAPKEISISKNYLMASAQRTADFFDLGTDSTCVLCLPAQYIGGSMMLIRTLVNGWTLHLVKPSVNPISNVALTAFDFIAMTPHQCSAVLEDSETSFTNIKKVLLGGAPLHLSLERKLENIPSTKFYIGYGMTETASHVAIRSISAAADPYYHAVLGASFSTNAEQQLIIHAHHLGIDHLITNDIVELIDSTTFLWKGRSDFIINSGGIKLQPEVIEKKLAEYISADFFIHKEPHDVLGEQVVLITNQVLNPSIKKQIRNNIPSIERPKKIYLISDFVKTASGKVDRYRTFEIAKVSGNEDRFD